MDSLRLELSSKKEGSFDYSDFYKMEDKLDSIIDSGGFDYAKSKIDSLLNNNIEDEFRYAFYFRKGKILYLEEKYDDAIYFFTTSIKSTQRLELESYFWRGFSYAQIGKCSEAFSDFNILKENSSKYIEFEKDLKNICDSDKSTPEEFF